MKKLTKKLSILNAYIDFSISKVSNFRAEAFKIIVMNKLEISNIKLYFSTDLRQNQETLEKTLVEFKLDPETQKYKMENIEVKLLGL